MSTVAATVATDGSVKDGTSAGGALAIYNGAHNTRGPNPTEPVQTMQFRVYGTPSSNRAELYAVLRALRLCKPVKELHIQCDSETSKKMVFKAVSGKHIKHNTPNRDLIMRCAAEMKWRHDQPGYKTEWHDVEAHSEKEPWEHKKADLLAGLATEMPLPPHNANLRELEPAWALLHKGIPCQDDGLKTTLRTLENEAAKAGDNMSPHLRPSLLSRRKHSGESQAISCRKTVDHAVQEILFRLKFGAVKGTPGFKTCPVGDAGGWHKCPRCGLPIRGADRQQKLHGLQWTDHALHHCAHRELVSARSEVERALTEKLKACISLSETLEGRPAGNGGRPSSSRGVIHIRSLTEFPSVLGQPPSPEDKLPESGLVIDLRGYVPLDIHKRIKTLGVTSSDISSMFNAAKRPLQVLTKLIDRQDITRTAGEGRD